MTEGAEGNHPLTLVVQHLLPLLHHYRGTGGESLTIHVSHSQVDASQDDHDVLDFVTLAHPFQSTEIDH